MKSKIVIAIAVIALVALAAHFGLVPGMKRQASAVPTAVALSNDAPDTGGITPARTVALSLPSTRPAAVRQPVLTIYAWEWNAQMGLMLANGGMNTMQGSAMEKHGVGVKIIHQDDTTISQASQVKFANTLATSGAPPADSAEYVVIMGDGAGQYLQAINTTLKPLGPDFRAEIIGAVGYSRGEDAWWGPQEWKDNPEAMKGGVTAGVLRDGDWNIAQYKLANDGIKNNPDETTYDPDAMNWVASDTYLTAVDDYITGHCSDRPVVRNGKLTNEAKHHTCADALVTWSPGDVNMAKGKGGLVRLLSTKENVYQMPAVIIGIHKWNVTHAKQVQAMLAGAFDGADLIKQYPEALTRAGVASYNVYNDQTPGYWVKYYKGVTERDKTGNPVPLGGSTVMNLADNLVLFGLAEGTGGIANSLFKATYEGFGNIAKQQYPKLIPTFPTAAEATNLTFLQALQAQAAPATTENAALENFDDATAGPIAADAVVAKRDWSIVFSTGSAQFSPSALDTLEKIYQQLVVGGALQVQIDGHTDNVGSPTSNQVLSEARAQAVALWLMQHGGKFFPAGRIVTKGYGDTRPIAPNITPAGQALNRRVTITLGTKG